MDFPGQGSVSSCSFDLCRSCSTTGSFNPLCQTGAQTCILELQGCCQSCYTIAGPPEARDLCILLKCNGEPWKDGHGALGKDSSLGVPAVWIGLENVARLEESAKLFGPSSIWDSLQWGRLGRQEESRQAGCLGSSERESLKVAVVGGVRSSKESSTR